MKKNAFTLVEMLAVILIMALLTLVVLPPILNQVNSQKENVSEISLKMIYDATDLYISEDTTKYPKVSGDTYCISLETLVNNGFLKKPLTDMKTGKEIPLNKKVKVLINNYGEGTYTLVEQNGC